MNSAIWKELHGEKVYRFQVHGRDKIHKLRRRIKYAEKNENSHWSECAYGWDDEGEDVVIFRRWFKHPSHALKYARSIDPNAELLD